MELCGLDVDDLRQRLNGELAIRVQEGKGKKQRLVPYGAMSWCLVIVDSWLTVADITNGAVFRSLWKGGRVRISRLSVRAVEDVVKAYPVAIDGALVTVAPHDLRRTYARRLHDAGMGDLEIQNNLGHSDRRTTERYIGVAIVVSVLRSRYISLIYLVYYSKCRLVNQTLCFTILDSYRIEFDSSLSQYSRTATILLR
jgi:site-specific recombinase XerD